MPALPICCRKKKAARKEEPKNIGYGQKPFFERSWRQSPARHRKKEELPLARNPLRRNHRRKRGILQKPLPKNRFSERNQRQKRAAESQILRQREKRNRREPAAKENLLRPDWDRKRFAKIFLYLAFPGRFYRVCVVGRFAGRKHPALEIGEFGCFSDEMI